MDEALLRSIENFRYKRDMARCNICGVRKHKNGMRYVWNYVEETRGLCLTCDTELGDVDEIEKLLKVEYKDFREDHNLYFRLWHHMWPRNSLNEEPYINYFICLIWERMLYFKNYGAEVAALQYKFKDKTETFSKIIDIIDTRFNEFEKKTPCNDYYEGYSDALSEIRDKIIGELF